VNRKAIEAAVLLKRLDNTHEPRANGSALLTTLAGGYGSAKRAEALNAIRMLYETANPPASPFGDVAA
jgi:hypothetical protein